MSDASLALYLEFTKSPTRSRIQRTSDYNRLCRLPCLEGFTFLQERSDVLVVGTKPVTVTSDKGDDTHVIGSFLVFLQRTPTEFAWDVAVRFHNATGLQKDQVHFHARHVHHPHIVGNDEQYGVPTGTLCIQKGQHTLYRYLREARIVDTVLFVDEILHTYMPSNGPFLQLNHWPRRY